MAGLQRSRNAALRSARSHSAAAAAILLTDTLRPAAAWVDQPSHGEGGTIYLLNALLPTALIAATTHQITSRCWI